MVSNKQLRFLHGSREADIKARNAEQRVLHDKLEKLQDIQIDEANAGRGHSAKANRATADYAKISQQVSSIQFGKYGHLQRR